MSNVVQIIPADGWEADFYEDYGTKRALPLVCFGLTDDGRILAAVFSGPKITWLSEGTPNLAGFRLGSVSV